MCGIAGYVDFNKKSDYKVLKNIIKEGSYKNGLHR